MDSSSSNTATHVTLKPAHLYFFCKIIPTQSVSLNRTRLQHALHTESRSLYGSLGSVTLDVVVYREAQHNTTATAVIAAPEGKGQQAGHVLAFLRDPCRAEVQRRSWSLTGLAADSRRYFRERIRDVDER
eukprot:gb/GECH01009851.1/.p1 GENE.gb/GECH01009851.1/~~gb/GECH01009851.1/.p1  ORF type:complete len:130 (+),score=25.33 gb/GECH01009851.1/:1-390(+)